MKVRMKWRSPIILRLPWTFEAVPENESAKSMPAPRPSAITEPPPITYPGRLKGGKLVGISDAKREQILATALRQTSAHTNYSAAKAVSDALHGRPSIPSILEMFPEARQRGVNTTGLFPVLELLGLDRRGLTKYTIKRS